MRMLAAECVGAGAGEGALAILAAVAFERAGFRHTARQAYRTAVEAVVGPMRADLCVVLARQCRVDGLEEEAVAWARRALLIRSDDDHLMARACFELIRCGALDDAYAVLRERCAREPVEGDAALGLAELLLWAGRTEEARPWLDRALASRHEDARALRCLGVLHALEGRWSEAREAFSRSLDRAPGDMETATWLSETHLRLGDRPEAERMLIESRAVAQTPVHLVLGAALYEVAHVAALLDVLGEPVEPWLESPDAATREALTLLDSFGGNRGKPLTRLDAEPSEGSLGLRVVRVPESDSVLSSRDASADTLKLLGTIPLVELERRFEELAERYPESPHPLCYWGELDLWLGEYERAIARFEAALSRSQARWGYVGQAAARILRGEYEAADEAIAACNREFAPVVGATTHVYVGEALRRRGDLEGAVAELTEAVRVKPGRAGAWMNLALAHRALDARDEARRIFHRLEARLPRLYWDTWRALGEAPRWPVPPERMPDLFEKALEMMRGNRSSHTITYFDAEGVFRIARDADDWRVAAAHHGTFLALGLQSRLAAGAAGETD
jgi:tetratricopeptide (TPR) repeat protein